MVIFYLGLIIKWAGLGPHGPTQKHEQVNPVNLTRPTDSRSKSLDLCLVMEPTWVRVKMGNMLKSPNGLKTVTTTKNNQSDLGFSLFRSSWA